MTEEQAEELAADMSRHIEMTAMWVDYLNHTAYIKSNRRISYASWLVRGNGVCFVGVPNSISDEQKHHIFNGIAANSAEDKAKWGL